ncbi:MAG: hypothetical protein VXV89_07510 [Candidatus Thermoplasmatota archaeon]|nr:hypothetical protein [Candidatus Thermoplasmatota archaeon]
MEEKDDFWGEVASEQNESIPSMIISDGASSNENVLTGVTQTISAQQNQMVLMQKPSDAPKIIGVLVILWGGFTILLTLSSPFINELINNLLPEEERLDLTMGAIDYFLALVSILTGLAFIYSGSLLTKRQRFGVQLTFGLIIFSFIVGLITFLLEPVPPSQENAPGMHYGLGIGFQIFCGAICFLIAAIPLMVNNAHLEPVNLAPTSQSNWGDENQF